MIGATALRTLFDPTATTVAPTPTGAVPPLPEATLAALVDELAVQGHGLVLCMGKGGVGKTTIAAAVAVALARRGHPVHLTTTDPAAHLTDTLPADVAGLQVSRIDPLQATQAYRDHVMATKGKNLDDAGRCRARRGPAVAVHRRGRGVPAVRPRGQRIPPPVRCHRHRPHRPHPAAAGRCRLLPPRRRAATGRQDVLHHPTDDPAGPRPDQGHPRHPGRTHPGPGGPGTPS